MLDHWCFTTWCYDSSRGIKSQINQDEILKGCLDDVMLGLPIFLSYDFIKTKQRLLLTRLDRFLILFRIRFRSLKMQTTLYFASNLTIRCTAKCLRGPVYSNLHMQIKYSHKLKQYSTFTQVWRHSRLFLRPINYFN